MTDSPEATLKAVLERMGKANANGFRVEDAVNPLRDLPKFSKVAVIGRSAIEALAAKPVVYVWQDIAVAGTITLLAGGPACGKTTLLFLLIAARLHSAPTMLLHRMVYPAPRGKYVVLIEAEHNEESAARKLLKSFAALDLPLDGLDRLILVARKSVYVGDETWLELCELVQRGLVSDIVVDTIARATMGEANDEQEQIKVFGMLAKTIELGGSEGPKVWLVAHTRKSEALELEDVSGSTQRTGQADTVLLMKAERRDGMVISSKVKFAKLREDPEDRPMPVDFVMRSGKLDKVVERKTDERPIEEQIWECLALGPQTKNRIREKLKRSGEDVEEGITNLFAQKCVMRTEVSIRGRGYPAFMRKPGCDYDAVRNTGPDAGPTPQTTPDPHRWWENDNN